MTQHDSAGAGLSVGLDRIWLLTDTRSRSVSPENPTGSKGRGGLAAEGVGALAARELGPGWKISPAITIAAGEDREIVDVAGPGALQQMWFTATGDLGSLVLRIFWDDQPEPAVECPLGAFFAQGWQAWWQVSSLAVCTNPRNGLACYWPMPFRQRARVTVENIGAGDSALFYQVNYALDTVPARAAYFHAQYRSRSPLPIGEVYSVLDGVVGAGHYVGTYLAWSANSEGWWGEGELKFYLDGDGAGSTITGTGLEDYICGAWGFEIDGEYCSFSTPYTGFQAVPNVVPNAPPTRFGMYRWHLADPIRFSEDLHVTVQALGWGADGQYRQRSDDIATVAYWYQQAR